MPDARFARIRTDPRFRKLKKQQKKLTVDARFKSLLEDDEKDSKKSKVRVDKYGRKRKVTHDSDNLRRFYHLDEEEGQTRPDYARGEGLVESSSEEDVQSEEDQSGDRGFVVLGRDLDKPISVLQDEAEIDLDESTFADLDAQAELNAKEHDAQEQKTTTKPTARLAVVNLDWNYVKASHLYKVFSSLVSTTASNVPAPVATPGGREGVKRSGGAIVVRGKLLDVRVYPSDFGKKRMAREDKEGPPPELFREKAVEDEQVTAETLIETNNGEDYDEAALRKYQLERLGYYYAIATFDSPYAAQHVYTELDGTELERSANVFDLSYVPDDMTFDDEFRDEATADSVAVGGYQPIEFTTDALRHSKVKLTWDDDDPERTRVTRRTLSRKEIDELDFQAYIASSGSESDSGASHTSQLTTGDDRKRSKRDRLRALLLGGNEKNLPEGWGGTGKDKAGELEISFVPGLSAAAASTSSAKGGKKGTGGEEETTLERYQRKEREKKKAQKAAREAARAEGSLGDKKAKGKANREEDAFFAVEDSDDDKLGVPLKGKEGKKDKGKYRVPTTSERGEIATEAELALLLDTPAGAKHFDMSDIIRTERRAEKGDRKKRGKKQRQAAGQDGKDVEDDFELDTHDPRFNILLEDHNFAIDPSNPHFKKTKSMKRLLEERSTTRDREGDPRERKRRKL